MSRGAALSLYALLVLIWSLVVGGLVAARSRPRARVAA